MSYCHLWCIDEYCRVMAVWILSVLLSMLTGEGKPESVVEEIQDKYLTALQWVIDTSPPQATAVSQTTSVPQPAPSTSSTASSSRAAFSTQTSSRHSRLGQLLTLLPQVHTAASLLLSNKMIYVPFLLNRNLIQTTEEPSTSDWLQN